MLRGPDERFVLTKGGLSRTFSSGLTIRHVQSVGYVMVQEYTTLAD